MVTTLVLRRLVRGMDIDPNGHCYGDTKSGSAALYTASFLLNFASPSYGPTSSEPVYGSLHVLSMQDWSAGAPGLPTRILFPRKQRLREASEARAKWWICGLAFHQWHALVQLEEMALAISAWPRRVKVALNIARVLRYLHNGAAGPICPHCTEITNFEGCRVLVAKPFLSSRVIIHDGPLKGNVDIHSNTFSFYVILLELISGRASLSKGTDDCNCVFLRHSISNGM